MSIQVHIVVCITERFLQGLHIRLRNLIVALIDQLPCSLYFVFLVKSFLDLAKIEWVLAAGKLDVVKLNFLTS